MLTREKLLRSAALLALSTLQLLFVPLSACGPNRTCEETFSCPTDLNDDGGMPPGAGPSGPGSTAPDAGTVQGDASSSGGATAGGGSTPTDDAGDTDTDAGAGLSSNATLSALSITPGFMSPAFAANTTTYSSSIPILTTQVSVTATTADAAATLRVNDSNVVSGATTVLNVPEAGGLVINVDVEAEDGTMRTYSVTLARREVTYFKASDTAEGDRFGESVALDGDTLAVGAPEADGAGAVYVFHRENGVWSEQQRLKAPVPDDGDQFGISLALEGDTLVVGAPMEDSNADTINGNAANNELRDSGAVYVFQRNGSVWAPDAYLKPSSAAASDRVGLSVFLDDATLAVGSVIGGAYVFSRANGAWIEAARLDDPSAARNVSVEGDTLAVGVAPANDQAFVFQRSNGEWTQHTFLEGEFLDAFGSAISLKEGLLAVGAPSAPPSGAVFLYQRSGNGWPLQIRLSPIEDTIGFGSSLSIAGHTLAVGISRDGSNARGVNGNSTGDAADSGAVRIFRGTNGLWSPGQFIKAINTGSGDHFGTSVSLSGEQLAVGAPEEDSSAKGVNRNQDDNSSPNSGAVYIY